MSDELGTYLDWVDRVDAMEGTVDYDEPAMSMDDLYDEDAWGEEVTALEGDGYDDDEARLLACEALADAKYPEAAVRS
jgi:hypothetical protein